MTRSGSPRRAPQPRHRRSSRSTTWVTSRPCSRRPCFLRGALVSPLTGIVFEGGWFYLVHRQTNSSPWSPVGAVSQFQASDPVGTFQTLISGFPSFGDHPNSQIVFGDDGRAYINGAAPTNSSVVGPDNSWAPTTPTLHDFPGMDIELSGIGYPTLISFPAARS